MYFKDDTTDLRLDEFIIHPRIIPILSSNFGNLPVPKYTGPLPYVSSSLGLWLVSQATVFFPNFRFGFEFTVNCFSFFIVFCRFVDDD